jgi:outer membrane protein
MKKLALSLLLITSIAATAQKIGHVSLDSVLRVMPETDSAKKTYSLYANQLETTLDDYTKDFNAKYKDYQIKQATYPPLIKKDKEKELDKLNQHIAEFKQQATENLQHLGDSIQKPILVKAKNAINAVAEENGYYYIFDTSGGIVLYAKGDNVYGLVLKKLGVTTK